jgi:hypothetical protein
VLATIVDTQELWKTIAASFVAGVGITLMSSLTILGFARLGNRDRSVATAGAGLLAVTGLLLTVAGIALGMVVMLSK